MDTEAERPESTVPTINSVHTLVLDLPPSCIEFSKAKPDCFVVGTYELLSQEVEAAEHVQQAKQDEEHYATENTPQKRSGSLILFVVECLKVHQIQNITTHSAAILDLHFSPHDPTLLCAATSTGTLTFYRLGKNANGQLSPTRSDPYLHHLGDSQSFHSSTLILFCAWHPTNAQIVGVTLSTGDVALCHIKADKTPGLGSRTFVTEVVHLHRHSDQAWTSAFALSGNGIFSGGDDSVLWYQNLPQEFTPVKDNQTFADAFELPTDQALEWRDRRIHGAGVTAVLPITETIIVTGSFDDRIRVLEVSPDGRPQVQVELNIGGGVWRLKVIEEGPLLGKSDGEEARQVGGRWVVLASCMHAGVRLVEIKCHREMHDTERATESATVQNGRETEGQWSLQVLAKFEEHTSMNYGSDVKPEVNDVKVRTFVSTSFYDRKLCLWQYELP